MKANELMIGDWLFYKGQFNAFPFKVEQITKRKVGYHAEPNEGRLHYIILSECKPIPITPEFLKRNGFGKAQSLYFLKSLNKIYPCPFFIEYNTVNNCLFVNDGMIPMPITYVHQLQHVLRLCGIEKEVEL